MHNKRLLNPCVFRQIREFLHEREAKSHSTSSKLKLIPIRARGYVDEKINLKISLETIFLHPESVLCPFSPIMYELPSTVYKAMVIVSEQLFNSVLG